MSGREPRDAGPQECTDSLVIERAGKSCSMEEAESDRLANALPGVAALKILEQNSQRQTALPASCRDAKRKEEPTLNIIGTDSNSTVDNKSMLNALLNAVCAVDDTVEQHDDSHVQQVIETKVPKAAEDDVDGSDAGSDWGRRPGTSSYLCT